MAKFCTNCGAPLKEGAKFCSSCGERVPEQRPASASPAAPEPEKNVPQAPPAEKTSPKMPQNGVKVPDQFKNRQSGGVQMPKSGVKVPEQFKNRQPSANRSSSGVVIPEQFAKKNGGEQPRSSSGGVKTPERFASKPQVNAASAQNAPQKSRKGLVIFTAIVLIGAFLFTGFVAPGFLRGGGGNEISTPESGSHGTASSAPDLKTEETEKGAVSAEKPAVTLCGVTVDVIPESLGGGSKQITVSKLESTTEGGVKSENYELAFGDHEKFDIPVEVTFPCKISKGYDPTVEHYNAETNEWEPLISYVDEKNGTVSAYFGSFSPARVSYLPVGVNPQIYKVVTDAGNPYYQEIEIASNYWKILRRINPEEYSDEVNSFIDDPENYAIDLPKLDPSMDTKLAYEAFMESNTIWSFCDPIINMGIDTLPFTSQNKVVQFMIDHSEKLGNAMNAIPFVVMAAQLVYDLKDFDPDSQRTAAVNLYKNLVSSSGTIYSLVTGYSHIGFSLAFLGVSLFAMELDYFIDAAKAEQVENIKAVFSSYYENIAPFDPLHWFDVFHEAYWKYNGDADKAMKAVKDAVDEYCNQFWKIYEENGDDLWFAATEARYKNIFMNASPELKKSLTEQQKQKVWDLIERRSMKMIRRFLFDELQINARKQLAEVVEPYNRVLTFTIAETVVGTGKAELLGSTICFGSEGKPIEGWYVTIPDDSSYNNGWTTEYECTVLGYLKMGMPTELFIYDDAEDCINGEKPDQIRTFTTQMTGSRNTLIEFVADNGREAKSDTFTGYSWHRQSYGGTLSSGAIDSAMENALRNLTFKLDKNGDFNATGTGSYSDTTADEYDKFTYSVSATVTVSGHIDKKTGDGTYQMTGSVSYHSTYSNDYMGRDNTTATITYKSSGKIDGQLEGDMTFDPKFKGDGTISRKVSLTHYKGKAEYDKDSTDTLNDSKDAYFEMVFIANN